MRRSNPLFGLATGLAVAFAAFIPYAQAATAAETVADPAPAATRASAPATEKLTYRRIPHEIPSWYTRDLERKLIASGTDGVRLPAGATLGGGLTGKQALGLGQVGIRPGQWLLTLLGSDGSDNLLAGCTANFVFTKGSSFGLGTAGHCGRAGQLVSAYVVPPPTSGKLPGLYVIGKIIVSHDNGVGDDFALIEISAPYKSWVNPTVPVLGGPNGTYTANNVGELVTHFGHGLVLGTGGTPRAGVALRWDIAGGDGFSWAGATSPGDSGSPVLAALDQAAGDLTHVALNVDRDVVGIAGTRIQKMLQIAEGWSLAKGSPIPL